MVNYSLYCKGSMYGLRYFPVLETCPRNSRQYFRWSISPHIIARRASSAEWMVKSSLLSDDSSGVLKWAPCLLFCSSWAALLASDAATDTSSLFFFFFFFCCCCCCCFGACLEACFEDIWGTGNSILPHASGMRMTSGSISVGDGVGGTGRLSVAFLICYSYSPLWIFPQEWHLLSREISRNLPLCFISN